MKNLKQDKRTIDGIDFTVTQHPPLRALPLFVRLGKALGTAFFMMLETDVRADVRALGPALEEAFTNLSGEEAQVLTRDLLASTIAVTDGVAHSLTDDNKINLVFAGRLPTLLKALAFSAEVNFADFFDGWLSGNPGANPTAANPSS